jgi:prevent-host-death family protein
VGNTTRGRVVGREHKSHVCYDRYAPREITQRELRNDSGEIMRALDQGESFVVTRNGTPVGELIPLRRRRFISAEVVMGAFAGAPRIDPARFRADIDSVLDQDPTPRA